MQRFSNAIFTLLCFAQAKRPIFKPVDRAGKPLMCQSWFTRVHDKHPVATSTNTFVTFVKLTDTFITKTNVHTQLPLDH